MNNLLVDTNILVYGIDEDSAFYERSRKILEQEEQQIVTTSKNLVEFLTVVTKSSGYNLDTKVALNIIEEIILGVEIIYPTQESIAIFLDLINRYQPTGLLIHDFEIISIGLAHGLNNIATFNTKDFNIVEEISLIEI